MAQIDECLARSVAPREVCRSKLIFWLYYRCGFSASEIASLPNVELTTKGVESMIFRLVRLVRLAITEPKADKPDKGRGPGEKGIRPAESF